MSRKTLTHAEAREAARSFIRNVVDRNMQWNVGDIERYLPNGWSLVDAYDDDFHPVTIENVSRAIRDFAIPARP